MSIKLFVFVFFIFYLLFINMGRKSLNKTYEQVLAENRLRANKYYQDNREEAKKKAMERYNKRKHEKL